ncbi:methyltransferase-like protein 27 isoform X2 [Ambystoma mexicanum]|uniref:methyltransferase-like protein 27 isoform X2 n=1 Tax=Ambystoma mexicanum TaxID=8296 RepID=UPI0037E86D30
MRSEMSTPSRSLSEVRKVILSAHTPISVEEKVQFYDNWALDYEQDVDVLEYRAPRLAADCLASVIPTDRASQLILDVACGTGLVAAELSRHGFRFFHGVDGSEQMMELARQKNLYQELKKCMLGQEPLLLPAEQYDAVIIVGALSEGQVPCSVVPEICCMTKPGGIICLTTRCNASNLQYKAHLDEVLREMEHKGLWEQVKVLEVADWEKTTSEHDATLGSEFISGVVYLYRKSSEYQEHS